ncbi:amino acid ABC transporter permease [Clostridium tyrobutyricum]|uniref:amino acid ABC transporter permease n=1 Tax=Clostridium tyrobutyricum TaxID=1519 RepID=UPI00201345A3|nr:amino acid ABC transporter permease [Clostridium tyrobutyricum]MBR9649195.1 amino acid ABC transporter permease [Clostridium tyrobutyricum]
MNIDFIKNILPILLKGSVMTVELTIITIILGSILGILLALLRLSNNKVLKYISSFYAWIFRGTPLLLQLFFFYYGLPFIGIELTPFTAAVIGIQSIEQGQFEAAKALGFNYTQTMKKIILPQTFKVIIPPVGNEFISILKDTSLVSTIAMVELMRSAQQIYATSFDPISVFLTAAVFYLIMTTVFTTVFGIIERKLSVYN